MYVHPLALRTIGALEAIFTEKKRGTVQFPLFQMRAPAFSIFDKPDQVKSSKLHVGLLQKSRKGTKSDEVSLFVSGKSRNIKSENTTFLVPPRLTCVLHPKLGKSLSPSDPSLSPPPIAPPSLFPSLPSSLPSSLPASLRPSLPFSQPPSKDDTTAQRTIQGYSMISGRIQVHFLRGASLTLPPSRSYHVLLKMPVSVVSGYFGCETHMLCVQVRKEDDTVILFAAGECGKPSDNYGWKDMFPKAEIYVADCSPGLKLTMLRIPRPVFLQHVIPVVMRIHLYTSLTPFILPQSFLFILKNSSTRTYFFFFLNKGVLVRTPCSWSNSCRKRRRDSYTRTK